MKIGPDFTVSLAFVEPFVICCRNWSSGGGCWKTSLKKSTASGIGGWAMEWKNNSMRFSEIFDDWIFSLKQVKVKEDTHVLQQPILLLWYATYSHGCAKIK